MGRAVVKADQLGVKTRGWSSYAFAQGPPMDRMTQKKKKITWIVKEGIDLDDFDGCVKRISELEEMADNWVKIAIAARETAGKFQERADRILNALNQHNAAVRSRRSKRILPLETKPASNRAFAGCEDRQPFKMAAKD